MIMNGIAFLLPEAVGMRMVSWNTSIAEAAKRESQICSKWLADGKQLTPGIAVDVVSSQLSVSDDGVEKIAMGRVKTSARAVYAIANHPSIAKPLHNSREIIHGNITQIGCGISVCSAMRSGKDNESYIILVCLHQPRTANDDPRKLPYTVYEDGILRCPESERETSTGLCAQIEGSVPILSLSLKHEFQHPSTYGLKRYEPFFILAWSLLAFLSIQLDNR
ncbi:unnamed protein product [Soboliphyme baturini]|uniref:SCP domain-containing protein n=1 Tax=Soboliphyme baturini TaxID=241478 RepID=A0A183J8D5_9BILA|nr:unnamed protein product [Soboliphyme baturini]